ncbi:MAG: tRNA (N6-threonylcarbamoyladenosine(37)-N6)-methyltransferase TrmO [Clostridia bacterium]|nr:tRNA (N6-threonylcarbamoyladenosine(37)-N6)-methyltransferase TrmO [Clostridia bacterium]
MELQIIARIHTDLPTKFGIPRQSGLVDALEGTIVFEPEYRKPEALRGIEGFSHIWLLWEFSACSDAPWRPTVRPPRLGGNTRMGVFATRSPYRPNSIGLSCVRLLGVEHTAEQGTVLHVCGADLMDGTPIFDIKPYLPYADAHPDARGGFAAGAPEPLRVAFADGAEARIPPAKLEALRGLLAQDPRPAYQADAARIYGVPFAGLDVRFRVDGDLLTVVEVIPAPAHA